MPKVAGESKVGTYIYNSYKNSCFNHVIEEGGNVTFAASSIQAGGASSHWKQEGKKEDKYFIKFRMAGKESNVRAMLEAQNTIKGGEPLGPYLGHVTDDEGKFVPQLMNQGKPISHFMKYECLLSSDRVTFKETDVKFSSAAEFIADERQNNSSRAKSNSAASTKCTLDVLDFVMKEFTTGDKPKDSSKKSSDKGIDSRLTKFMALQEKFESSKASVPESFVNIALMQGTGKISEIPASKVTGTSVYAFPNSKEPEAWKGEHAHVILIIHTSGPKKDQPNPDVLNYFKWSVSKTHPNLSEAERNKKAEQLLAIARSENTKLSVRKGLKSAATFNTNAAAKSNITATRGGKSV